MGAGKAAFLVILILLVLGALLVGLVWLLQSTLAQSAPTAGQREQTVGGSSR
jgi:hypothetical protein